MARSGQGCPERVTVALATTFYLRFSRDDAAARHPRRSARRTAAAALEVLRAEGSPHDGDPAIASPRAARVLRKRWIHRSRCGAARGEPQRSRPTRCSVWTSTRPRRARARLHLPPAAAPEPATAVRRRADVRGARRRLVAMEVRPEHDAADSWFTDYAWAPRPLLRERSGGAATLHLRRVDERKAGAVGRPGELRRADRSPRAGGRAVRGRACAKEPLASQLFGRHRGAALDDRDGGGPGDPRKVSRRKRGLNRVDLGECRLRRCITPTSEQHLAAELRRAPGGTRHRTRAPPRRRARRQQQQPAQMSRPLRLASSYALVQRRSSEPSRLAHRADEAAHRERRERAGVDAVGVHVPDVELDRRLVLGVDEAPWWRCTCGGCTARRRPRCCAYRPT